MSNPSSNEQNHSNHSDQSVESIDDSDSDPSYAITAADKRDEKLDLEEESAIVYTTKNNKVSFLTLSIVFHTKYIDRIIIKEHEISHLQSNKTLTFSALFYFLC